MHCKASVSWLIIPCTVTVVIFHLCKSSYRHKNRFGICNCSQFAISCGSVSLHIYLIYFFYFSISRLLSRCLWLTLSFAHKSIYAHVVRSLFILHRIKFVRKQNSKNNVEKLPHSRRIWSLNQYQCLCFSRLRRVSGERIKNLCNWIGSTSGKIERRLYIN